MTELKPLNTVALGEQIHPPGCSMTVSSPTHRRAVSSPFALVRIATLLKPSTFSVQHKGILSSGDRQERDGSEFTNCRIRLGYDTYDLIDVTLHITTSANATSHALRDAGPVSLLATRESDKDTPRLGHQLVVRPDLDDPAILNDDQPVAHLHD